MQLKLSSPLKKIYVTQGFGQNGIPLYKQQGLPGHNGIDFSAGHGMPVYATHDGRGYYQIDSAGGHGVVLITDRKYDYQGTDDAFYKTIYWHLVDPIKEPQYKSPLQDFPWGKDVKRGDIIGYTDSTGLSTGDHLHFALKPVAQTGESNNSYENIAQTNGYNGAIDPSPYFEENVIPDIFKKKLTLEVPVPEYKNGVVVNWKQRFEAMMKNIGLYGKGKK